jgi:hypothetical protein
MGAWENGNFGNDDVMDFVSEVNDKKAILDPILKISNASATEYLESPDCCVALAAIEYLAASLGNPSEDFPEEARDWISKNKLLPFTQGGLFGIGKTEVDIIKHANQAIDKIKTNSELQELWQESGEFEDWLNIVEGLKKRIS